MNDWRQAAYRTSDLNDLHLEETGRGNPRAICAHVWCGDIQDGDRLHLCRPDAEPHRLKVYITRKDNEAAFGGLLDECQRP